MLIGEVFLRLIDYQTNIFIVFLGAINGDIVVDVIPFNLVSIKEYLLLASDFMDRQRVQLIIMLKWN